MRVPRPAPAQASPLPTLSRAPEPAVESRFVAQDQPREEEVHEASSEVDQLEENEPEGGWGEPAAKTGKPGVHNHRSEELGGSSPTQDHGQGSGQEQEQAHAAASEERASTQGMQK